MNPQIPGVATEVRATFPRAYCLPPAPPVVNEWKIQADTVLNMRISTYTIGRGQTELAAWQDAASRLKTTSVSTKQ
jgi:hypothetical protein